MIDTAIFKDTSFRTEVIDVWLMCPEKIEYKQALKKLIFMLYLTKDSDEIFRHIALEFYASDKDAQKYANNYCRDLFLIHTKEHPQYKKLYGIEKIETPDNCNEIEVEQVDKPKIKDWLSMYFGGGKGGNTTSMDCKK